MSDAPDALLECLVTIGRLHGKPVSRGSSTSGLPLVRNRLTPSLLLRAAERAGFSARLVKRPLRKIPGVVLPVVLVLRDNDACVLVSQARKGKVEVILPELKEGSGWVSLSDLDAQYTGYAIFLKPHFDFESRSELEAVPRSKSWFWGTLWRFRSFYAKLIPASILINLFAVAMPLFVMNVYDRVVPNQALETMWVLALGVAMVFSFEFMIRLLRGYFIDRAGKRADSLMASALFEHIMGIEMASKPASSGSFANQARAYETLREFFTSATLTALVDLPFAFLFIYLIFVFGSPAVAMVPLLGVCLAFTVGLFLQIPLRRSVREAYRAGMQRHAILVETINGLEAVKGIGAESTLQRRMEDCVRQSAEVEVKSRWYSSLATNVSTVIQRLVAIGVIVVAVYEIVAGNMTSGAMIACVMLSGRGIAPLAVVGGLLTRLQQSMAALQGLNAIMNLPLERRPEKTYVNRPNWRPDLGFDKVSFAYPQQHLPALQEVSFQVSAGERVAILGKTGSGKSTLLRLLMKLYSPRTGVVTIGGIDAEQLDSAELRRNLGFVPQEATLFYGTVRENIVMGRPWSNDTTMTAAAHVAGVDGFVDRHPQGYDLAVGERGEMLSGGQRQAIAIARALVGDPSLLLFDEPTTGMDANAEREFLQQLERYLDDDPERTLLVATHRTSLLKIVDRIIVLDDGKVVADGPKKEVLAMLQGDGKAA